MTSIPWAVIQAAINELRAQNSHDVTFRRNGVALSTAQNVRIERSGSIAARWERSPAAERIVESVVIVGPTTLDIAVKDRFTLAGTVYEVDFIHPTRLACTQADATAVE